MAEQEIIEYGYNQEFESDLSQIFNAAFVPNDNRPIYEWCGEYVSIDSGYSIKGKFDCSISPHFKKIFDAFQNPYVREVNVLAPPRSGKTLIFELSLLHTIANSSGDILWLQLTDEMAGKLSDLRMMPLIHSCKPVADLIDNDSKYSITEGRYKFLHSTVHVTSPKSNALKSVGYKYIFADEVWSIVDPSLINFIKRRTEDYEGVSTCSFFSQGGNVGSAWHKQFISGEQYEYGWTCPKCSKLQTYVWSKKREDGTKYGIVWPDDSTTKAINGRWIVKECAKQSVLECFHCRYQVTDNPQNRRYLLDSGDYMRVNENLECDPTVKSFRFTNFCNVKIPFAKLVTRFLSAQQFKALTGDTKDLADFIRADLADFWDEYVRSSRIVINLSEYDTANPFGEFEKFRFMTVDCQEREPFYYYVIRAWTSNGESRLVAYGSANTFKELDAIRDRHKVDYQCVFVDTGNGKKQESILSECVKYGRWGFVENIGDVWRCFNSLRGDKGKGWKHSDNKFYRYKEETEYAVATTDEADRGKSVQHVTFSSFKMSQILETLRDGKGKKWEANDVTEEYTTHLNSEFMQRSLKGNTADFEYVQKPGVENHFWDCEKMQIVAADLYEILEAGAIESQEAPIELAA